MCHLAVPLYLIDPSHISRVLDLDILRRIIELLSSSGEKDSNLYVRADMQMFFWL